jgi:hypothetical protein
MRNEKEMKWNEAKRKKRIKLKEAKRKKQSERNKTIISKKILKSEMNGKTASIYFRFEVKQIIRKQNENFGKQKKRKNLAKFLRKRK